MNQNEKKLENALLIIRIGLGSFLLLWSIDKLVAPESTTKIFGHFYKMSISQTFACLVGIAELVLSVSIIIGFKKRFTYGLGMVLHGISTLSTYPQLLSPFGKNHLFIAAIPVLAAFIGLYLLRDFDRKWSLDVKLGESK